MIKKILFAFLLVGSSHSLFSYQCQAFDNPACFCDLFCGPHRIGIGPEFYYVEHTTDGKIKEDGWMIGERLTYERLLPWCIYYGAEQYYARGCLSRKTPYGALWLSKIQDSEVEARIGYTFMNNWGINFTFTPFIGYGNFTGTNQILEPCFLKLTFRPTFNYFVSGFQSAFYFCNGQASIGLNMKWKSMRHGMNRIVDKMEPCHCQAFYQCIDNRTLIQIDVPLTYYYWFCRESAFEISIVPFYRNRIYGAKDNFPFDFLEEKYEMWGSRFMIIYPF